jgi:hypothetical protein
MGDYRQNSHRISNNLASFPILFQLPPITMRTKIHDPIATYRRGALVGGIFEFDFHNSAILSKVSNLLNILLNKFSTLELLT